MSYQNERLASFLKKEIALYVIKNFPRPEDVLVSVTKVFVEDSLENAKVFVSVFPEKNSYGVMQSLKNYESEMRKFLSSRLRRHRIPKITFVFDKNLESEVRLEKLLEKTEDE